ncbi:MAG: peptidylprolyl isomerase [Deltaproteobacteria bacterium]|nr:peptidylprolyl isomerase [Deltaproteobacteria bacterium]
MVYQKYIRNFFIAACLIMLALGGCGSKEEKSGSEKAELQKPEVQQSEQSSSESTVSSSITQSAGSGIVIDVDGAKLTKEQLESEVKKKMSIIKKQVPADRQQQVKENVRKQVINDFTVRTLLANEVNRLNLSVIDSEVTEAVDRLKSSLPKGMTIDDLMKKNKITKEKMQEEIRFGIKINKLVLSQMSGKTKPTEKEINKFYQKNKEKFKMPESVHVRHILVAKAAGDDDKVKTEKKTKAEDLRKQLVAGADFAVIAKNNSDCPSKQTGGDLGVFSHGEMVKQFEDAAFSQKVNAIGPVVETEFGYHIIQVLERHDSKTLSLDDKMKANISAFLEQQKQQEGFDAMLKKLRSKANIVVYQN